jgi:hypothetical protein
MRILLDECLPRKLKVHLRPHEVFTAPEMGWAGVKNGRLLKLAETQFDVFLTVDRNLSYQQNLNTYQISVLVLVTPSNRLKSLLPLVPTILDALQPEKLQSGVALSLGS